MSVDSIGNGRDRDRGSHWADDFVLTRANKSVFGLLFVYCRVKPKHRIILCV